MEPVTLLLLMIIIMGIFGFSNIMKFLFMYGAFAILFFIMILGGLALAGYVGSSILVNAVDTFTK